MAAPGYGAGAGGRDAGDSGRRRRRQHPGWRQRRKMAAALDAGQLAAVGRAVPRHGAGAGTVSPAAVGPQRRGRLHGGTAGHAGGTGTGAGAGACREAADTAPGIAPDGAGLSGQRRALPDGEDHQHRGLHRGTWRVHQERLQQDAGRQHAGGGRLCRPADRRRAPGADPAHPRQ